MAQEGFKRKLTAILSADVAGYSRLMDDDEEAISLIEQAIRLNPFHPWYYLAALSIRF